MKSKGEIAVYRISSFRRLCSATSPGCVAKGASSVAMCERRFSTFFLMAAVSCGWVSQRSTMRMDRKRTLESVSVAEMVPRMALRGPNPSGGFFAVSIGAITTPSTLSPEASSRTGMC